jgi:hypothetical protein
MRMPATAFTATMAPTASAATTAYATPATPCSASTPTASARLVLFTMPTLAAMGLRFAGVAVPLWSAPVTMAVPTLGAGLRARLRQVAMRFRRGNGLSCWGSWFCGARGRD